MKGCTFKRTLPSGHVSWAYSVYLGKDATGKKLRLFKSGFKREKDAQDALIQALTEKDADTLVKPDPRIFRAFMDEWLREHAARFCSPKTAERYRQLTDYTLPHIGAVPLQDLSAITLERLYNRLKDAGGWNRKAKVARPLSVKTVRNIAGVVHTALQTAVRWNLRFKSCRYGELPALQWPEVDLINRCSRTTKSLEQTAPGLRIKPPKSERHHFIPLSTSPVEVLKARHCPTPSARRGGRTVLGKRGT